MEPFDFLVQKLSSFMITGGPGSWDSKGRVLVRVHPAKVDHSGDSYKVVKDTDFSPGWVDQSKLQRVGVEDLGDLDNYELLHYKSAVTVSSFFGAARVPKTNIT